MTHPRVELCDFAGQREDHPAPGSDTVTEQILPRRCTVGPRTQQAPEASGVLSHHHGADHRQADPARPVFTEADRCNRLFFETLLRSRNDSAPLPFLRKCGKPTRPPRRAPRFDDE